MSSTSKRRSRRSGDGREALVTEQLVRDVAANAQLPDEEPGGADKSGYQHGWNDPTTHSDVEERDEHERPEDGGGLPAWTTERDLVLTDLATL
jgi:hypothetical protein